MLSAAMAMLIAAPPLPTAASEESGNACSEADRKFHQGGYEEALKLYKKANKTNKNNFECLWGMALTFNKLVKYKDALRISDQLIKISNTSASQRAMAWSLRGNTLFEAALNDPKGVNEKKLREAESGFRQALRIGPGLNMAHYNLGAVLIRTNRMDEGLRELRTYLINAQEPEVAEKARMIVAAPRIPVPVLEFVGRSRQDFPDGYRNSYTLQIKNWADFPEELFGTPNGFPPCYMGAPVNTRIEIMVMADQPPHFPLMCVIARPESLRQMTVSTQLVYYKAAASSPRQKKLYVRMTDRLTGNIVFSNTVALP